MRCRVKSAVFLGIGRLQGYQLTLHKRGMDGSAKADVVYTGKTGDVTWGVVYQMAKKHKSLLDDLECVIMGYDSIEVNIALSAGGGVQAWTYLARTTVIDNSDGNTSPITLGAGTKDVFCTLPAAKAVYLDSSDDPVGAASAGFALAMAVAL